MVGVAKTPNAYWKVEALIRSLSHAGWGEELQGRQWQGVRTTLYALAAQVDSRSGTGLATAEQVADCAGLSARWTRRCLNVLEDLGIIEWVRGGIRAGKTLPSRFCIIKQSLVERIKQARLSHAERVAERKRRNAQRAEQVGNGWRSRKKQDERLRRSCHAELSAKLPPLRESSHRERALQTYESEENMCMPDSWDAAKQRYEIEKAVADYKARQKIEAWAKENPVPEGTPVGLAYIRAKYLNKKQVTA